MDNIIMDLISPYELQEWRHTLIKIGLTVVLAGLLGLERESRGRPAGLRTHILVCLGATLLMIVSDYLAREFNESGVQAWLDRGRIAAGVVTGVGFLGAGTIVRIGHQQRGLTTAAMVWFAACLGVAIGSGFYLVSILSTLVVLVVVRGLWVVEPALSSRDQLNLTIRMPSVQADTLAIEQVLRGAGCSAVQMRRVVLHPHTERTTLEFQIDLRRGRDPQPVLLALRNAFAEAQVLELHR